MKVTADTIQVRVHGAKNKYHNPYISSDHTVQKVKVISFLITPTGRVSKFYQYSSRNDMDVQQCINDNQKSIERDFKPELKKGYTYDTFLY